MELLAESKHLGFREWFGEHVSNHLVSRTVLELRNVLINTLPRKVITHTHMTHG